MVKTSLPELNEILGGGFPAVGASLIVGTPRSGKTLLAANIVSTELQKDGSVVAVISEDTPNAWVRLVTLQERFPRRGELHFLVSDLSERPRPQPTLLVIDRPGLAIPRHIRQFAFDGPVIVTSNQAHSDSEFIRSASVSLALKNVKGTNRVRAHVTKSRSGQTGGSMFMEYDSELGLIDQTHVRVPLRSRWDLLTADTDII
jgi:hypothetical protein